MFQVDKNSSKQFISSISFFLALISAIFIIIIAFIMIYYKMSPYDIVDAKQIKEMFIFDLYWFIPKKVEKLQYISGLILFPTVFTITFLLYSKFIKEHRNLISINKMISFISSIFVVYILFITIKANNFLFIRNSFLYNYPMISFVFFMLVLFILHYEYKLEINKNNKRIFVLNTVLRFISVFFIICTCLVYLIDIHFLDASNADQMHHINSYFNSIVQVYLGKAINIDLINAYGLYPHFLEPILKIFGISIINLSCIFVTLFIISWFCMFWVMDRLIDSKVIVLCGILSILFLNFLNTYCMSNIRYPYYQYYPHRLIFPALLILTSWYYINNRNKLLYIFSFIMYALGVLWNLEIGIIVFITWVLVLMYQEFFEEDKTKILKRIGSHLVFACATVIVILISYFLYDKVRYGEYPDLYKFCQVQRYFGIYGYGNLPRPIINLWLLVILSYFIGLGDSIKSLIKKDKNTHNVVIFLLSILGLGIFSYYQGRSHDYTLATVIYPAIIIVSIYLDKILKEFKAWNF